MKKILLILLIIHCSLLIASAQWFEQYTGVTNTLMKTTNGGTNWVHSNPQNFILYQNYPNPFNGQTTFEFEIIKEDKYKFIIYDLLGRELFNVLEKSLERGVYKINFDSKNLPSGTYFYRLLSNILVLTKSFQIIK